MSRPSSANAEERRRRLDPAELTPEQRAAVEARRVDRQTPEYQEQLARDIDAYRQDFPPAVDHELIGALAELRRIPPEEGGGIPRSGQARTALRMARGHQQAVRPDTGMAARIRSGRAP